MFGDFCKMRDKKIKNLIKKGDSLLEEELDIINIIENIRNLKNESKSKFIIDVDEESQISNTSRIDKSLVIDEIIEMQKKTQDSEIKLVVDDLHLKKDNYI